jgi:cobalt-zinc-cadmium efflux system outer membrane protein
MRPVFFLLVLTFFSLPARPQTPGGPADPLPRQLTLNQAEEALIHRNLVVSGARNQVEIAEAARQIAGLRPNPTLQLGMEQIPFYSNIPGSVPRLVSTNGDAGANPTFTVQASQLLERGGKRVLRAQQADAVLDATRAQILDVIRQQLIALRVAFTSALLAKENLQLAEDVDRQYLKTEDLMAIRLRAGDIAVVDLERVKAARLAFRQAVIDARSAYWQATRDIQTLLASNSEPNLNSPAEAPLSVTGELAYRPLTLSLKELREMALAERPDLTVARRTVAASERGTRLAESLRKRDLTLALEYQRVGNDQAVGAILSFPLFMFNNQQAAIAQAASQQRFAETQQRQVEVQVLADVDKAYYAVMAASQAVNLYSSDAIARANRVREVILYSYQRGEADLLDVLDAQRSNSQILVAYNQAKAVYQNAMWQLQGAVGRSF